MSKLIGDSTDVPEDTVIGVQNTRQVNAYIAKEMDTAASCVILELVDNEGDVHAFNLCMDELIDTIMLLTESRVQPPDSKYSDEELRYLLPDTIMKIGKPSQS